MPPSRVGGVSVQTISQGEAGIPTFVWTVPMGQGNIVTHQLLNVFKIGIYNADFTQLLLTSPSISATSNPPNVPTIVDNGLDINGNPDHAVVLSWTPTAADWDAVKGVFGVKHLMIGGGLFTTDFAPYFSGPYFSDAYDFTIVA